MMHIDTRSSIVVIDGIGSERELFHFYNSLEGHVEILRDRDVDIVESHVRRQFLCIAISLG